MRAYRIAAAQFAEDLSGEGARLYGGRWNPQGIPVLYTAESLPLAVLETLVNVPVGVLTRPLFSRVVLTMPDETGLTAISVKQLPEDWPCYPPPVRLAEIGREWLVQRKTVGLKVPSTVAGGEGYNILLNPRHPDFSSVKIESVRPFVFDARLLRQNLSS